MNQHMPSNASTMPGGGHAHAATAPPSGADGHYRAARRAGWRWALAGGGGLVLLYVLTLSVLNGVAYTVDTTLALWYWMAPLVVGFGLQMGLFAHSRSLAKAGMSPHSSGVMASGGASAVSMIACCAHHLTDVLPLVGLAGVTLLLSSYQSLFLLAGVLSNVVGIAFILGEAQKHHLYDPQGALLAPLLRLPVRRSVPWLGGIALLILAVAVYQEVWA